ncbi:hypothetical protein QQ008_12970 [Fulvivirgaceae bacterium BMA10]|uniref:DUF3575 domain-containing protein n=1 Tax=Splendidivirga corallicola TaxID=3051826 RepID=A0ABT8KS47_9BACT|nr:hypothetical protein [Fulvivirgaceae bacterium BMA10]
MKKLLKITTFSLFSLIAFYNTTNAQNKKEFDKRQSISFGVVQPILGGFNVTFTQQNKRFLFAYSHGTMLHLDRLNGAFKSKSAKKYQISQITYISTGFDLGIRLLPDLSIRGEWKWHLNDLEHPDGQKIQYHTLTIGPSIYHQWHPFKKAKGLLSHILVEQSIRWWPVVYSSLDDYAYNFINKEGEIERFTHDKGDLFVAASIGWTF